MKGFTVILLVLIIFIFYLIHSWGDQAALPYEYVSPRPNARLVSALSTIAVRYGDDIRLDSLSSGLFQVVGTHSGLHQGQVVVADDDKTVIFRPDRPFTPGETVTVEIRRGMMTTSGKVLDRVAFHFAISPSANNAAIRAALYRPVRDEFPSNAGWSGSGLMATQMVSNGSSQYATLPDDYPVISVTVPANETGDGYVFLSNHNYLLTMKPYLLILDNSGDPVYYKRLPGYGRALDFKKQPNGWLTYYHEDTNVFHVMDSSYTVIDTIRAGHGYSLDRHDLQVLPNGHILLIIYDPQPVDMSKIVSGGDPNATVVGLIIQELDTSKNVVFEWRSWDHFSITDSYRELTASWIDPFHGNAVELDYDGNILICSRGTDEITKIDRRTGDIIWRMGGKNNEFTFVNDPEPTPIGPGPHDIRRIPNGNITLFDNRIDAKRPTSTLPDHSRVVEYQLDESNKTATLVWEYRNDPDTLSWALANAQRLPNGNTVVGWGLTYAPAMTEIKPDGTKAFELAFLRASFDHHLFLPTILRTQRDSSSSFSHAATPYPTGNPSTENAFQENDRYIHSNVLGVAQTVRDGIPALPFDLQAQAVSYRAFRFPWHGYPLTSPILVLHTENPTTTLYYSWNGATEIASYRVYAGRTPDPNTLVDVSLKTGFETRSTFTETLDRPCFFRVMPIDNQGGETRRSNLAFVGNAACETAVAVEPTTFTTKPFFDTQGTEPTTITLQIPAGAVTESMFLVYTHIVSSLHPSPPGYEFADVNFALDGYQDSDLIAGFEFQLPITLTLTYGQNAVAHLNEETLTVYYWDGTNQRWSMDGITVIAFDTENNQLVFTLPYASELALFGEPLDLAFTPTLELLRQKGQQ